MKSRTRERPALAALLRRRGMTLVGWITEQGVRTVEQVEARCTALGAEAPHRAELEVAFAPPAVQSTSAPTEREELPPQRVPDASGGSLAVEQLVDHDQPTVAVDRDDAHVDDAPSVVERADGPTVLPRPRDDHEHERRPRRGRNDVSRPGT